LEKQYMKGRPFQNTLQTNGTLLDDKWCEFLANNQFLVGLSLDGPEEIHDRYRVDVGGKPTFKKVYHALKLLQKHGVEHNVLAAVAKESAEHPLAIYRFFKEAGVEFIQFSPIVERLADEDAQALGLKLAGDPLSQKYPTQSLTPWSVEPEAFGDFFIAIFDEWVRKDVGKTFIMNFEWILANAFGGEGPVCTMSKNCGNACIVEHNGDIFSCDHFVYPEYKLGNILTDDLYGLVTSLKQTEWGARKQRDLPQECHHCSFMGICRGGCPKHRFYASDDGTMQLNYLCKGYKKFYQHAAKYMTAFGKLLELDLPLTYIMEAIKAPFMIPPSAKTGHQQIILWVR